MALQTRYKAKSFDELTKPLQEYAKVYQATEDQYNTLNMQTATLKERAAAELQSNPESQWAKRYLDYSNQLQSSLNDLMINGLNPTVRNQLAQARIGYASNIKPVEDILALEKEIANTQYKMDPKLRMVNGANPTIDQWLANPSLRPSSYSGADIENNAKGSAAAMSARRLIDTFNKNPSVAGWMRQYHQQGITNSEFMKALTQAESQTNDKNLGEFAKQFREIIQNTADTYKYRSDNTLTAQQINQLDNEVISGIRKGITATSNAQNPLDNYMYLAAQEAYKQAEEKRKAATKKAQEDSVISINPRLLYTPEEYDIPMTDFKKYEKYFDEEGNVKKGMENDLLKEYNKNYVSSYPGTPERKSDAKRYFDKLNQNVRIADPTKTFKNDEEKEAYLKNFINTINKVYKKEKGRLKDLGNTNDLNKDVEYHYNISDSSDYIKNRILKEFKDSSEPIEIVSFQNKDGKRGYYKKDTIKKSELTENYKLITTTFSTDYGSTAIFQDKEGNVVRIKRPTVHATNENTQHNLLTNAKKLVTDPKKGLNVLYKNYLSLLNQKQINPNISDSDIQDALIKYANVRQQYDDLLRQAHVMEGNMYYTDKIEDNKANITAN